MSSPVYRHVDDIDLYVGGFLEKAHEDSILGPVFKCIIGDQFARLKKGDRFFYDLNINNNIAFTLPQLDEVSVVRILPWQNYINIKYYSCQSTNRSEFHSSISTKYSLCAGEENLDGSDNL